MTRIAILPISIENGMTFCAISGDMRSEGATAGAALDALTAQLPQDETDTLVIVQNRRPDAFFNATQQQRGRPWLDGRLAVGRVAIRHGLVHG